MWLPAGGYTAYADLTGTPTACLDAETGEFMVDWTFSIKSDNVAGFSATTRTATAGGIPLISKSQTAFSRCN